VTGAYPVRSPRDGWASPRPRHSRTPRSGGPGIHSPRRWLWIRALCFTRPGWPRRTGADWIGGGPIFVYVQPSRASPALRSMSINSPMWIP